GKATDPCQPASLGGPAACRGLSRDAFGLDRSPEPARLQLPAGSVQFAIPLFEDGLRYSLQLHVGSALVDRPDLSVAIEFLDRVVPGVSVPAKKLDAQRGHSLANL